MNKKALNDEETIKYKIEKTEPIGSSHMVSGFFIFIFFMLLLLCIGIFIYLKMSEKTDYEDSDETSFYELIENRG